MPAGSVHTANSLTIAATLSVAAYFYNPNLLTNDDSMYLVIGSLSGIFLSPDLDVDNGYVGLRFLRSIPLIGGIVSAGWKLIWTPYAKFVPHRSWISHFPGISTIIRLTYLSAFMSPVLIIYWDWIFVNFRWLGMWMIGLCLSDIFHFFADLISGDLNGYSGKDE